MFKRSLLVAALGALAVSGTTLAHAATRRPFKGTVRFAVVSQSPGYPAPGSTSVSAGVLRVTLGAGAVIEHLTITGHPTATTYTFRANHTDFYERGILRTEIAGTATIHADGSLSVVGKGRFAGGTGLFRHATGTYRFNGTSPPPARGRPSVITAHLNGTVTL